MRDEQEDFPAAHSMDTHWFAVDADGHVGVFNSLEGGAVPNGYPFEQDAAWTLVRRLALEAPAILWNSGNVSGRHCNERVPEDDIGLFNMVLFVRPRVVWPTSGYGSEPLFSDPFATPDGPLSAAYCGLVEKEVYDELHAARACMGCGCDRGGRLSHLGLFEFLNDQYENDPYKQNGTPTIPLKLTDLPPQLQELAQRVRLTTAQFQNSKLLQPLEHVPCNTWGGETYGSSDGQTRLPMPKPELDGRGGGG